MKSILRKVEIVQRLYIKHTKLQIKVTTTKTKIYVCCLQNFSITFLRMQNSHFDLGMAADL